ncbi:MAG: carbon-nitrogen hydrolase family protein [Kiritimatiellae bacterium]|nr:carbon-nitrogen hydrolase family protein [Kiritimatiellia bacterium]
MKASIMRTDEGGRSGGRVFWRALWFGFTAAVAASAQSADVVAPGAEAGGWTAIAARAEIAPIFSFAPTGGYRRGQVWVLAGGGRTGVNGWWRRAFPITGGRWYRFRAVYQARNLPHPDRNLMARISWHGADGRAASFDVPPEARVWAFKVSEAPAETPWPARPADEPGWEELSGVYWAPSNAASAVIELQMRWAPEGMVRWSGVELEPAAAPARRPVRVAAVHLRPSAGRNPADKPPQFAPLIEEAARRGADLVVLPEVLTYYGTGRTIADCAEPIPGPSTRYFGELARRHDLYIVAGLVEREGALVYNVAVLIGPDGEVVGRYRKVTLPQEEIAQGVEPGGTFPVFDTRFGRVGMMVCYDGFYPEVARALAHSGAEIIAWPVWGCDPLLAAARACENRVWIVSSTYMNSGDGWMRTAVWDPRGEVVAAAEQWGTLAFAEIDLAARYLKYNLADFRVIWPRHRPPVPLQIAAPCGAGP